MAKREVDARFAKFGTVSFTSVTQVNDFISHLEESRVMGTRCKKCGQHFFPPHAHCCNCLAKDMEWFDVSGNGRLLTYSTLQYAPTGFSDDLPYTIALLDYGNYKVFGRIDRSLTEADLSVGMEMKTVAGKTLNDQLTYMFQKA